MSLLNYLVKSVQTIGHGGTLSFFEALKQGDPRFATRLKCRRIGQIVTRAT
jgi:hypothetical protein